MVTAVTSPQFSPPDLPALTDQYAVLEAHFRERAETLMKALIAGTIGLAVWIAAMQAELRRYHLAATLLVSGGIVTAELAAVAQKRINDQFKFFSAWAESLRTGTAASDAMLLARVALYFAAGRATLWWALTTSMGMPTLPAYPGDGTTECLTNCLCRWDIVQLPGSGNFDATWALDGGEHCPQCLARSVTWNPLQIRNGQIL